MQIKITAKVKGITPEMVIGVIVVNSVYESFKLLCRLTSINDSKHGKGSLHSKDVDGDGEPDGNAVDFGTKEHTGVVHKPDLVKRCKEWLGPDYDVVLENPGDVGPDGNEHLHVEYDPKS